MNAIDLLTQCRIYHRNLDGWDRKPDTDTRYYSLRPFIRAVYQGRLQSGTMTAGQGGYASHNPFARLIQNEENGSNNNTVGTMKTLAATINSHFVNSSAQTVASIDANTTQVNVFLQQLAGNNRQLHHKPEYGGY